MNGETGKRRKSRIELEYYQTADWYAWWRRGLWLLRDPRGGGLDRDIGDREPQRRAHTRGCSSPPRLASKGPACPAARNLGFDSARHATFRSLRSMRSRWSPAPWAGTDAGSKKCTTCHAGPIHHQNRAEGIRARLRRVPSRPPRPRRVSPGDGRLGMHKLSPETRRAIATGLPPCLTIPDSVTRFDQEHHHPDLTAAWTARCERPNAHQVQPRPASGRGVDARNGRQTVDFRRPRGTRPSSIRLEGRRAAGSPDSRSRVRRAMTPMRAKLVTSVDRRAAMRRRAAQSGRLHAADRLMKTTVQPAIRLEFDAKLPSSKMRHGISAQEVFADLKQLYTAEAVKADPDLLRQFVPPRPLPGQPASPANQVIQQAVDQKVLTAARILFGAALDENVRRQANVPAGRRGCVECHVLKPGAGPIVNLDSLAAIEIEPPLMTPVWQKHAFFNHTTHRALNCAACHAEVDLSKENGDRPLLPDITKCVTCHVAGRHSARRSAWWRKHLLHRVPPLSQRRSTRTRAGCQSAARGGRADAREFLGRKSDVRNRAD